jgi:hypothetical protein
LERLVRKKLITTNDTRGSAYKDPSKKKIPKEALKEDQIKPKNYLSVCLKSKPVMKKLVLLVTC